MEFHQFETVKANNVENMVMENRRFIQRTNPFPFLREEKWNRYRSRPVVFEEMPIYIGITPLEIIDLENRIRRAGYKIVGRFTRNSTKLPASDLFCSTNFWRQQTDYYCLCMKSQGFLVITINETASSLYTRPLEVKYKNFFSVEFTDTFKPGGFKYVDYKNFKTMAGGRSYHSSKECFVRYFTPGSMENKPSLDESITLELLMECRSRNMYKKTEEIPKIENIIRYDIFSGLFNSCFETFVVYEIARRLYSNPIFVSKVNSMKMQHPLCGNLSIVGNMISPSHKFRNYDVKNISFHEFENEDTEAKHIEIVNKLLNVIQDETLDILEIIAIFREIRTLRYTVGYTIF